jgi:hypothetical protein
VRFVSGASGCESEGMRSAYGNRSASTVEFYLRRWGADGSKANSFQSDLYMRCESSHKLATLIARAYVSYPWRRDRNSSYHPEYTLSNLAKPGSRCVLNTTYPRTRWVLILAMRLVMANSLICGHFNIQSHSPAPKFD